MCDLSIKEDITHNWILQGNSTYHLRKKLTGLAQWQPTDKNWRILEENLQAVIDLVTEYAHLDCQPTPDGQSFWVTGDSTYAIRQILKDLGATWDKKEKKWQFPMDKLEEVQNLQPVIPKITKI